MVSKLNSNSPVTSTPSVDDQQAQRDAAERRAEMARRRQQAMMARVRRERARAATAATSTAATAPAAAARTTAGTSGAPSSQATSLMTGDIPPTPEEVLETRGQALVERYESLVQPPSTDLADRGIALGPILYGPKDSQQALDVSYGGVYEGDDPNLQGKHVFELTSDTVEGGVLGLRLGETVTGGALRESSTRALVSKTVYVDETEARELLDEHLPYRPFLQNVQAGVGDGASNAMTRVQAILGLSGGADGPDLTDPTSIDVGNRITFETSGKARYAIVGTAGLGPATGVAGYAHQTDATQSLEVTRLDADTVQVTIAPQNLDTQGIFAGITGVNGHAAGSLHTTLAQTFTFDLTEPDALDAYRATLEGNPPSGFAPIAPERGQGLDAQAVLQSFENENLPAGVKRTFAETVEVPLTSLGVTTSNIPLAGKWGVKRLRASGAVVVSDGEVALTQSIANKQRTQSQFFSGDAKKTSGSAVHTLTVLDDAGQPQTRFGGVVLTAAFEDTKLTGKDLENNIVTPLNDSLDLGIPIPERPGDGGARKVNLELTLDEADLERLATIPEANLRVAAMATGADANALLALKSDLAQVSDPLERGLRVQAYVKDKGFRGLSTVVRSLDAKERLDVQTTSSTYTDANKESNRLRTFFPGDVDASAAEADLRLRFNSGYAALKQIDVAVQELRDDVVLQTFDPAEYDKRMAALTASRERVQGVMSLDHLPVADQHAVYDKIGTPNLLASADEVLTKYPDPIEADATKAELKARFSEAEKVLFNLDAKIQRIEEGDTRWLAPPFADNYLPLDPDGETLRLAELRAKRDAIESRLSFEHLSTDEREAIRGRVLSTDSGLRLSDRRSAASNAILSRLDAADAREKLITDMIGPLEGADATTPEGQNKRKMAEAIVDLADENPAFVDLVRDYEQLHGQLPKFDLVADLPRPMAWDGQNKSIVAKATSSQFDNPQKLQRRIVMELANATLDGRYEAAWEDAKAGRLDEAGFVEEMERIEYDAVKKHHAIFGSGAYDPRDLFGDKLAGDWSTFEGFKNDQSRPRGSVDDSKVAHTELYEAEYEQTQTAGATRGYVYHSTVPKTAGADPTVPEVPGADVPQTSALAQIDGIEDLTIEQLYQEIDALDDAALKTQLHGEVEGLLGRMFEKELLHYTGNETIGGLRNAIVKKKEIANAADAAELATLLDDFDRVVPLPSRGGAGGFGNLGFYDGEIVGRPGFSSPVGELVPTTKSQNARHIVSYHNIRDAFGAMYKDDPAALIGAIDAENNRIMGNLQAFGAEGGGDPTLAELRTQINDRLKDPNLADVSERRRLAEMSTFLEATKGVSDDDFGAKKLSELPATYGAIGDQDKVLMGVYQANSNPINLWAGNGKVNQALNSVNTKLVNSVQNADSLEALRTVLDEWTTPGTVHGEVRHVLNSALAEAEKLTDPAQRAAALEDIKDLATTLARNSLDVDVDPFGRQGQKNVVSWHTLEDAADAIHDIADGVSPPGDTTASTVVGRLLNYDPVAGVSPTIIGTPDEITKIQGAHDRLLESSPAYHQSFQAASELGGELEIEVVDDADRVVSYDLESNTIRIKRSALEGADADTKLMSRLAFEMSNAENQARFKGLVGGTKTALADGAAATADDFAERALRIEYDSFTNFEQIRREMRDAEGSPRLSIDSDVDIPRDWDAFLESQKGAKRPNNGGKVGLYEHYTEEFGRLQSAVAGGTEDAFSLQVWKPRGQFRADNADFILPFDETTQEPYETYWADEDGKLYGNTGGWESFDPASEVWTEVGAAPAGLPAGTPIHVNPDTYDVFYDPSADALQDYDRVRYQYDRDGEVEALTKYDANGVKLEHSKFDDGARTHREVFEDVEGEAVRKATYTYETTDGVESVKSEVHFVDGERAKQITYDKVTEADLDFDLPPGDYTRQTEYEYVDGARRVKEASVLDADDDPVRRVEYEGGERVATIEYTQEPDQLLGGEMTVESRYRHDGEDKVIESKRYVHEDFGPDGGDLLMFTEDFDADEKLSSRTVYDFHGDPSTTTEFDTVVDPETGMSYSRDTRSRHEGDELIKEVETWRAPNGDRAREIDYGSDGRPRTDTTWSNRQRTAETRYAYGSADVLDLPEGAAPGEYTRTTQVEYVQMESGNGFNAVTRDETVHDAQGRRVQQSEFDDGVKTATTDFDPVTDKRTARTELDPTGAPKEMVTFDPVTGQPAAKTAYDFAITDDQFPWIEGVDAETNYVYRDGVEVLESKDFYLPGVDGPGPNYRTDHFDSDTGSVTLREVNTLDGSPDRQIAFSTRLDPVTGRQLEVRTESKYDEGTWSKASESVYDGDTLTTKTDFHPSGEKKQLTRYIDGEPAMRTDFEAVPGDDGQTWSKQTYYEYEGGDPKLRTTSIYDENDVLAEDTQYGERGEKLTTREFDVDAQGRPVLAVSEDFVGAPGEEVARFRTEHDAHGVKVRTGVIDDAGEWAGAVREYAPDGALRNLSVYDNGQVVAGYDPATNTLTGINLSGTVDATSMTRLNAVVNGLREEAFEPFFDNNERLLPLIETMDFAEVMGMDLSAIEDFDLDSPETFKFDDAALDTMLADLENLPPGTLSDEALASLQDMRQLRRVSNVSPNGFRMIAWTLADVVGGSASDIYDTGKTLFNIGKFIKNGGGKMFGRPLREFTEEALTKTFSQLSKFKSVSKIAGPLATIAFIGVDMYMGIQAFRQAKAENARPSELAYHLFTTVGGGIGGGVSAAVHARQEGHSRGTAARAFFAGMFGVYDPDNPGGLIESIRNNRAEKEKRRGSRDTLASLRMPGFDGGAILDQYPGADDFYENIYNWRLEDEFYEYMEENHSDSDNFVPRIDGINGEFIGVEWQWYDGQMPVWGRAPGAPNPPTSPDHLQIVEFTNQPVWKRPPVSQTGASDPDSVPGPGVGPGGFGCWVAREVYGEDDPKWLAFREWLLTDAPTWFRWTYLTHGERFAAFIADKPRVKAAIRGWMDARIGPDVDLDAPRFVALMRSYREYA